MEFIPYGTQTIEEDDIQAVVDVLKSGYLTTGPKIEEFEKVLCGETGAKYAVAVSSGTAALHIATMTLDLKPDDEVIVSPLTFAASANCILYCGAKPIFADINPETMLINAEDIKRKITPKTKAIIPVHYGGELCDMDILSELGNEFGLEIIQDCAHALGGIANEKKLGEYAGQQIWSFHPVKTITTGEGGAVTTNDRNVYNRLLRLRSHGITRDASSYSNADEGGWYYEMLELGYNYRITDIQCALGISQLNKLSRFAKRRAEIVRRYDDAFKDLPLKVQMSPDWSNPVRHIYTIRLDKKETRKQGFDELRKRNIGVNVHYIPVYWLPYYEKLGYEKGICPVAEDAYERLITIPLYPLMTDNQVEYVIASVKEVLS